MYIVKFIKAITGQWKSKGEESNIQRVIRESLLSWNLQDINITRKRGRKKKSIPGRRNSKYEQRGGLHPQGVWFYGQLSNKTHFPLNSLHPGILTLVFQIPCYYWHAFLKCLFSLWISLVLLCRWPSGPR